MASNGLRLGLSGLSTSLARRSAPKNASSLSSRGVHPTVGISAGKLGQRRDGPISGLLGTGKHLLSAGFMVNASSGVELAPKEAPAGLELATFAGGCFWGLELAFQRATGVNKTTVGYTQGLMPNPNYALVCSGLSGHTEAVQVTYDPKATSYKELLEVFYANTDPTTLNRQGNDNGSQYRSGIYYHNDMQKEEALASISDVEERIKNGLFRLVEGKKVVVEVKPAADYYVAEDYHQQYLEKGGRFGRPQSAAKGCRDKIRCYG